MPPWPLPDVWIGTSIENDDYTWRADFLRRIPAATRFLSLEPLLGPLPSLDLDGIHWVIAGGESGPGHGTLDLAWARDIRDRCASKDVAFFFKSLAGRRRKPAAASLTAGPGPDAGPRREHLVTVSGHAGQIVVLGHVIEAGDHASLTASRGRYAGLAA
jgi:protein gp37